MRIPVSTYRIQFTPGFGFRQLKDIIPYLTEIGITDIYASPIFKAKKGSLHGYDVVDMTRINPELGTEAEFEELIKLVRENDMGWIQDIVPNHMAFDGENQMLMDVLENGHHSEYFDFFDIEWNHFYESLSERLLAPFLGQHYSESLDAREIRLEYDSNGFHIHYYALALPLKIESYVNVITHRLNALRKKLGEDHPDMIKFLGILYSLKNLPDSTEERLGRYSQIQFIKRMFWELYSSNSEIRGFIDENISIFNGQGDSAGDISLLDRLLSEQLFRLSFWKVATEELNYRRFFNINGLISLRMDTDKVFNGTHGLILSLARDGKISGLRIDHIDGLYDPTGYLRTLRERTEDMYVVVEKILEHDEELPSLWAVQGTTGYDFLNYLNGLFVDAKNGRKFNRLYYSFTGFKTAYDVILYEKKKLVIEKDMTGDVDNLAHLLKRISSRSRYGNDMTLYGLKKAIIEILAHFPVYRTYVRPGFYSDADRRYMSEAITRARCRNPDLVYELSFIELFLLLEFDDLPETESDEWIHFVMRFQQMTSPLMAKGFEDTMFYIYNRLISLNEVGGSPDRFGVSLTEFHEFNRKCSRWQPYSMNATATHDTKRGEDARARINALSEMPDVWEANIKRWSRFNRTWKKTMRGKSIPEKNDEYFLYQTLIGCLPFFPEEFDSFLNRLKEYIIKEVREAKVHTAWLKPDSDYEDNYLRFIDGILTPSENNQFLGEFMSFQKTIAYYGIFNSLSQTLIKITAPGIPDFYQGEELWDLSFVDPDNRRPVDFGRRRDMIQAIKERERQDLPGLIKDLLSRKEDGQIKLFLMYRALSACGHYHALFERGEYIPLQVAGEHKNSIIAYAWQQKPLWAVIVCPRFLSRMVTEDTLPLGPQVWKDTQILLPEESPDQWQDQLTGAQINGKGSLTVSRVLEQFPVSLLISA